MQQAEAYGPEKQGVSYYETVDEAEQKFKITKGAKNWMREMVTVDKRQAIEYQHYRRGESVVAFQHKCKTQDTASQQRNAEIQNRSAHRFVEDELDTATARHDNRREKDNHSTNNHKNQRPNNSNPCLVLPQVMGVAEECSVGEDLVSNPGCHYGDNTDRSHSPSADGEEARRTLHHGSYILYIT